MEYVEAGDDFLRELLGARGREPDRLILFPYPNTSPKLRRIAIPSFRDLLGLWVRAGRIVRITDPQLSARVFGRRLARKIKGPGWHFRNKRRAWDAFVAMVSERSTQQGEICNTDVANYYGSIDIDLLEKQLRDLGCSAGDVRTSIAMFETWQKRDGLKGLPVGLDSSSVLGMAFLRDADVALERQGIVHGRWVDEFTIVGPARGTCRPAIGVLQLALAGLKLSLSEQKTHIDPPAEGLARLRSTEISLIEAVGMIDPELEEELIHERFDEILSAGEEAEGRLTRWLLSALTRKADRYAPYRLATKPGTMNVDPAATAKFFMRFFRSPEFQDERVTSALCEVLTTSPTERTEALHLHIMRVLTLRSFGDPEGRVFERPALDADRPPPVRCWAWQAYATTPRWSIKRAKEFIESEADPLVRRAALMTLKHRVSGRRALQFLDHIEGRFPESKFTTAYLRRAA